MFLKRVIVALEHEKVPYALVGGYAVALHGAVRGTVDIDLAIALSEDSFAALERAMLSLGLESRLPVKASQVFHFRDEYIRERNLVAWSFYNARSPSEIVDVVLTHDAGRIKTQSVRLKDFSIRVATIDELIRMKSGSDRLQDRADVEALMKLRGRK